MADYIEFTPTPADVAAAMAATRPPGAMAWLRWPQRWQEGDARLGTRAFVLGKDGFETFGPGFKTEIDWTAVSEIAERGDTLLLITEWQDTYFIPRRVFPTRADADAFAQHARNLWSSRWDSFNAVGESAAPSSYDLTYRLGRADIAAFLNLRRELTGWRKSLFFLGPLVFGGLFGWFRESSELLSALLERLGSWAILAVLAMVGLWYLVFTIAMSLWRAIKARSAVLPLGDTALAADESGIKVSADGNETRYGWRDVPAVTLGPAHVFLSIDRKRALVVPLRAFRNRMTMIGFYNFAEEASNHAEA